MARLRPAGRHSPPEASRLGGQSTWLAPGDAGSWLPTGLAGDSRWLGLGSVANQRWQRQLAASRRWAVAGALLGALVALVLFAPARWLAAAVAQGSQGHLLLADAQGSLWTGSAVPVLTGGPGSRDAAALPGRLHWQLRPAWNGLALTLQQPCCLNAPLRLDWLPGFGTHRLLLRPPEAAGAVLGQWPTAWLAGLGTPWNTLQLRGSMQLSSPGGLTVTSAAGRLRLDGQLALELRDLSSRLSPLPALGSYRLQLGAGPGLGGAPAAAAAPGAESGAQTLRLDTLAGPLRLQGEGQWTGARLRFRGEASAEPGHEAGMANLLNIIGRRQGARSVIAIG